MANFNWAYINVDGVTAVNALSASTYVSASNFYGDGSGLTNVSAVATPAGNTTEIQYNEAGALSASSNLTWDNASSTLNVTGQISASLGITGSEMYADEFYGNLEGAIMFPAINDEGASISKGQVVYIKGTSGQTPTVALAACDDAAKMPAFGLASNNAANGAAVQIVSFGNIQNLNLASLYGGSFSVGDTVFVQTGSGGTSGSLTATAPTGSGNLLQNMGRVIRNGGGGDGQIKVGGAGRANATPNLDKGYIFIGNDTNQTTQDNTIYVSSSANQVGINTTTTTHTLTVNGAISGTLLYGDGSNLSGISGGSSTSYNSFTANFDVSASYDVMGVNSSGSVVTASLAAANAYTAGQRLVFKDIEGSGSTNNIVIEPSGSQTIDGGTSVKIQTDYGSVILTTDGSSAFYIIGTN